MQSQISTNYMSEENNITLLSNSKVTSTQIKMCARCSKPIISSNPISKSTLKALGKYFHEDCFVCFDCSKPLKPKYFPYKENETNEPILLCQYDYFRRHDLLCKVCDKPLRGLYYTAFGGRYDQEHFACTICQTPCGVKKCFIFDGNLYCKYHFLKFFSKRCKGCKFPISDQYIEFPKGEEIHCWHPECYGIYKYWHVNLSAETLGLPLLQKCEYDSTIPIQDINPTSQELQKQMQAFSFILSKIWSILYRFEEETASCISDMFQYLSSYDQLKGIEAAALFVLKVECLFKALDNFNTFNESLPSDAINGKEEDNEKIREVQSVKVKYGKFPRNLITKILIYLQLLRKLNIESYSKEATLSSFMSVITGLAHFLKLLTRYGLFSALEANKNSHSVNILLKFLREIERNELIEKDPFAYIKVCVTATDNCIDCNKYIQEECIRFHDLRWHLSCFKCSTCQSLIDIPDINESTFNNNSKKILCPNCSGTDPASTSGFKLVSKLSQLIYLLKIALVRSKAVMQAQFMGKDGEEINDMRKQSMTMQKTYIRTLNDIRRLRSRRESVRLTHNKQVARQSVILETPEKDLSKQSVDEDKKSLVIETNFIDPQTLDSSAHDNMFYHSKTLTLDDISRIVAAEQARELRPNAFTHFKTLKETEDETLANTQNMSGLYYSELNDRETRIISGIGLTILINENNIKISDTNIAKILPAKKEDKNLQSNTFWSKMKTIINKEPKKSSPVKVFGTSLNLLSEKWGVRSDLGVGPTKIQIPIIVDELISSLRQMDMSVEGIFRKNGNIRRLREITTQIDENPTEIPDLSKENAFQLSALLKKFFRELPDPILSSPLYKFWINAAEIDDIEEKQRIYALVYSLLPLYNRNILEVLLSFLYWTSSFSHVENEIGSKMDIHNLSTVIAPNILYQPASTDIKVANSPKQTYGDGFAENEGQYHFLAIEVIDYLITHNEEIVMVPRFMVSLLNEAKDKNIEDYESVSSFVNQRLKENKIDFSEFNVQQGIKVNDLTANVEQKESSS